MSGDHGSGLSTELQHALFGQNNDQPPVNPGKMAQLMRTAQAAWLNPPTLKPDDIIRQREGLRTVFVQMKDTPYIFLKYLDEPKEQFAPYFRLDCIIGRVDQEGDVLYFVAESNRYEVYPQADLDRLSVEAARKIN